MGREILFTADAPAPVGPYSQAVHLENDLVFTSGQLGVDPATNEMADGAAAQTEQALKNTAAILHVAGGHLGDVLKATIFLTDMNDFSAVNEKYAAAFGEEPPARSCVQVAALPLGAAVEIECIARV